MSDWMSFQELKEIKEYFKKVGYNEGYKDGTKSLSEIERRKQMHEKNSLANRNSLNEAIRERDYHQYRNMNLFVVLLCSLAANAGFLILVSILIWGN